MAARQAELERSYITQFLKASSLLFPSRGCAAGMSRNTGWPLHGDAGRRHQRHLILDRLPSRPEAEIIRAVLRIPKRRHLSEEQREIATERLARARLNAQKPASPVPAVYTVPAILGRPDGRPAERAVDGG